MEVVEAVVHEARGDYCVCLGDRRYPGTRELGEVADFYHSEVGPWVLKLGEAVLQHRRSDVCDGSGEMVGMAPRSSLSVLTGPEGSVTPALPDSRSDIRRERGGLVCIYLRCLQAEAPILSGWAGPWLTRGRLSQLPQSER